VTRSRSLAEKPITGKRKNRERYGRSRFDASWVWICEAQ